MSSVLDVTTRAQAEARLALINIRSSLNRRSEERWQIVSDLVDSPSFFWIAECAGFDPLLCRRAWRAELARVAEEGFGLVGKGDVGSGKRRAKQ